MVDQAASVQTARGPKQQVPLVPCNWGVRIGLCSARRLWVQATIGTVPCASGLGELSKRLR